MAISLTTEYDHVTRWLTCKWSPQASDTFAAASGRFLAFQGQGNGQTTGFAVFEPLALASWPAGQIDDLAKRPDRLIPLVMRIFSKFPSIPVRRRTAVLRGLNEACRQQLLSEGLT